MITTVVDEIVKACESMADRYIGALIVIEIHKNR